MNEEQQKQLDEMIRQNGTVDTTNSIREKMHSSKIRKDISVIQNIKRKMKTKDFASLDKEASRNCTFLFKHYPNIYNKMLKDQINLKILYSFLDELEKIEKGEQNQHEASFRIGTLLKQIYVDKNIDLEKENRGKGKKDVKKAKKISYEEYKKLQEQK